MTGLRHVLRWYSGDEDLQVRLAELVLTALADGRTVGVVLRPPTERALRGRVAAELGPDAVAGLLRLQRRHGPDGPSGQDDVARAARVLHAHAAGTGAPMTVVTDYVPAYADPDCAYWTEVEAAAEVALADLPLHLHCWYPEDAGPLLAETVRATHPLEYRDGALTGSRGHREPRGLLAERPAPVPSQLGTPATDLVFDAVRLRDVRAVVDAALRAQGFGRARTEDVTVAVNEVATNAVHHGGGRARLLLWTPPGEVVCEVHDGGTLTDPLPGLAPPDPRAEHGRGLWIARRSCDLLHVWGDRTGTHVRIRASA